jgi:multicomponent K+:H+ antiporter subunit E
MSLVLAIVWLLLVNSVAPGQIVLGILLGVLVPLFSNAFWPGRPRVQKPLRLLRYFLMVLGDIVVANLQVARLILGSREKLRPAFVRMPIALRDEFAIVLLTSTVSLTPGTVSAEISEDKRSLLLHALDAGDTEALIAHIQRRYEAPLLEIFPC